jgi:hypothetical protein
MLDLQHFLAEQLDRLAPEAPDRAGIRAVQQFTTEWLAERDQVHAEMDVNVAADKQALEAAFATDIDVPEPPAELRALLVKLRSSGITGFVPHYLPEYTFTSTRGPAGFNVSLTPWFFEHLGNGDIAPEAARLRAGWYLVDSRTKPNYDKGQQRYDRDYLEPVLAQLRRAGALQTYQDLPEWSRFGTSPAEVEGAVLPELARTIFDQGTPRSLRYVEYAVLSGIFHREWGETDTLQWFADPHRGNLRLCGGRILLGGMCNAFAAAYTKRDDDIAFSVVVEFAGSVAA